MRNSFSLNQGQSQSPEDQTNDDFASLEDILFEDSPASTTLENSVDFNRARFYVERLTHHLSPGRMLDVQAGCGIRMVGFRNHGWQVEGLTSDHELLEISERRFDLTIHSDDVLEFETPRRYDLVIASNIADDQETGAALAAKIASLVARDGYVLAEHHRSVSSLRNASNPRQLLHITDQIFNQLGFARVDWGRTPRETRSELLKAALLDPTQGSSMSRLLRLPMQLVPDGLDVRLPEHGCLWSMYQKA